MNDGETVHYKARTRGFGGNGEAKALSNADVTLFKPAVAILACAVIATGVLALADPLRERHEESYASSIFANNSSIRQFNAEQAKPGLRLTNQNVAAHNRLLRDLPAGYSEKFAEAWFEFSDNVSLAITSPAVFNPEAVIQLPLPKPARKPSRSGPMATIAALDAHFDRLNYNLANLREPGNRVPRVYLEKLPVDMAEEKSVTLRKRIFIKSLLPVVLRVNEEILAARQKLQTLRNILDNGISLTDEQRDWLYQIAKRYKTDPYDWNAFMSRVDIVPPSLAIAQAAEESGWGTSRFAREGNALFGQYTFSASNGMLPEERANGRRHLIRAYANLIEGVRSYIHNLNYHRAYKEFRAARKWMRNNDNLINGHTLAGELIRYSERGADYVKTLRRIMHANELLLLDHTRLHEDRWTRDKTDHSSWQSSNNSRSVLPGLSDLEADSTSHDPPSMAPNIAGRTSASAGLGPAWYN